MEYIKIRLSTDLDQYGPEFEKTIDAMFQSMNPLFSLSERSWKPQIDIYETPEEIIVLAEIAGVDKDDIEVEVNSRAMKVSGVRRFMFPEENTSYCLAEIQYGEFERILFLPAPIDTDVVSASYSNGLLQIRMAKWFADKSRKILID